MDAAHVHLMLNHVPVLGAVFGLLVLGYGRLRRGDDVIRVGLWTLALVGAVSVVVYLTGEPAEELVEGLAGVSEPSLERHEEFALWATLGAGLVGAVALIGLVRFRARPPSRPFTTGVVLLTLALSGLMGWTANLGGQVRHTEIRPGAPAVSQDGGSHDGAGAEGSEYGDEDG